MDEFRIKALSCIRNGFMNWFCDYVWPGGFIKKRTKVTYFGRDRGSKLAKFVISQCGWQCRWQHLEQNQFINQSRTNSWQHLEPGYMLVDLLFLFLLSAGEERELPATPRWRPFFWTRRWSRRDELSLGQGDIFCVLFQKEQQKEQGRKLAIQEF